MLGAVEAFVTFAGKECALCTTVIFCNERANESVYRSWGIPVIEEVEQLFELREPPWLFCSRVSGNIKASL